MNILVINTVEFGVNGISTVIMNYYQNMNRVDIRFDFVVNGKIDNQYKAIIESNNDRIFYVSSRQRKPIEYIRRLKKILSQEQYDIIHIHGNSALMEIDLYGIGKKNSAIKLVHAHNTQCSHKLLHKVLYRTFMRSFDYALACSEDAGQWLYGNEHFYVFNNGINIQNFAYDNQEREMIRKTFQYENKYVVLHIGAFNEQKNHTFLLDIFSQVYRKNQQALLVLIGEGELRKFIEEKVKQLHLEDAVLFMGKQYNVREFYLASDVFLFPSLFEGLGIVAIEAQCSGLPCVVSSEVPNSAKVSDNINFLSLQDSAEIWAEKVLAYEGNCERLDNSEHVRRAGFDIHESAIAMSEFYVKLIKHEHH